MLEEAGLIDQREGRYELTPKGVRAHRPAGARRPVPQAAAGPRRPPRDRARRRRPRARRTSTSPTSSATRSTSTSSRRSRTRSARQGAGTPVRLSPEDFEIERTEQLTRSRDGADARRVALDGDARPLPRRPRRSRWRCTRSSRTQFPRDYLGLVSFGRVAREVKPRAAARGDAGTSSGARTCSTRCCSPASMLERQTGTQADHHDHRRRADRPHRARRAVLRLPAVAAHDREDAARGAALHHGRASASTRSCSRRTLPPGLRRAHDEDEPRPGVLHDARDPRRLRARRLPRAPPGPPPRSPDCVRSRSRVGRSLAVLAHAALRLGSRVAAPPTRAGQRTRSRVWVRADEGR